MSRRVSPQRQRRDVAWLEYIQQSGGLRGVNGRGPPKPHCELCGATSGLQRDHRNGKSDDDRPENLRLLCLGCNNRERTKLMRGEVPTPPTCPCCIPRVSGVSTEHAGKVDTKEGVNVRESIKRGAGEGGKDDGKAGRGERQRWVEEADEWRIPVPVELRVATEGKDRLERWILAEVETAGELDWADIQDAAFAKFGISYQTSARYLRGWTSRHGVLERGKNAEGRTTVRLRAELRDEGG